MQTTEAIRGTVDASIIDKADRLFRNDDAGTFVEVLQNARRAGATSVTITLEEIRDASTYCVVTVQDDGAGIHDFQRLVTLGTSGWSRETTNAEDPAGMGFFSLCLSGVEVFSGNRCVKITPDVFLGKAEAHLAESGEYIEGTRLRFTRQSSKDTLAKTLAKVSEFYPLDVCLDGEALPRHDFLEGAIHRESIDGIEVGFATEFKQSWSRYRDDNWNFYGALLHQDFPSFTGLLNDDRTEPLTLHARFNVIETGRIKLQLPDRRSVIQNEFLAQFARKAGAAAYRCFQKQSRHALPFRNWQEARELGVALPEAACLLTTWSVSAQDENVEPLFGYGRTLIVPDLSKAMLASTDLANAHTLQGALHSGATLDFTLYEENPAYEGYAWYDGLPILSDVQVLMDGVPGEDCQRTLSGQSRPATIDLSVAIEQRGHPERYVSLPARIHVDTEDLNAISFVAVKQSPWDNEHLSGPFPLDDFLVWATFCASDDLESDSWQTQRDYYQEQVEHQINEYFRGPRATLASMLQRLIDSSACGLASQLGVTQIRFLRSTPDDRQWTIELAGADGAI
jgi:hypothetical protein